VVTQLPERRKLEKASRRRKAAKEKEGENIIFSSGTKPILHLTSGGETIKEEDRQRSVGEGKRKPLEGGSASRAMK